MIGAIVFNTCLSCGELMGEEYREKRWFLRVLKNIVFVLIYLLEYEQWKNILESTIAL